MNVVSVKEIWEGRQTTVDESSLVERSRVWRVVVDNPRVSEYQVIEAFSATTGIRRYSPWISINGEVDSTVRAQSLTAKQDSEAFTFTVDVKYTSGRASTGGGIDPRQERERAAQTQRGMETGQQPSTNPTQRPKVIKWGSVEHQKTLYYDPVTLASINNSAHERFVPAPTAPESYLTLTCERNQLAYDPIVYHSYANTVNSVVFQIDNYRFPAYTVLCKPITADQDHEGGVSFFKITFNFHINFTKNAAGNTIGWRIELADMGLNEEINGKLVPIEDRTNQRVTIPYPLNGAGRKGTHENIKFREFNRYPTKDLNGLRI